MNKEISEQVEGLTKLMYKALNLSKVDLWKSEREGIVDTDVLSNMIQFCREMEINDKFLSVDEWLDLGNIQYEIEELTEKFRINKHGRITNEDKDFRSQLRNMTFLSNQLVYVRDYLVEQYLAKENKERDNLEYEIILDIDTMDNLKAFIESTFPIFINRRVTEILNYKLKIDLTHGNI